MAAGISPWRVLVAATLEPAKLLGMADSLGNIRNTRRIRLVLANGRAYRSP